MANTNPIEIVEEIARLSEQVEKLENELEALGICSPCHEYGNAYSEKYPFHTLAKIHFFLTLRAYN